MTIAVLEPVVKARANYKFDREVDELAEQIVAMFRSKIGLLKDVNWQALEVAIAVGDAKVAMEAIPWRAFEDSTREEFEKLFLSGFANLGRKAAELSGLDGMGFTFQPMSDRVVDWARKHSADLVREITEETRQGLKRVITTNLRAGRHPYAQIEDIKAMVGLTERFSNAVLNYRARLEEEGLPPEIVAKRTVKYAERLHTWRAENIARTESLTAAGEAQREAWRQAADEGFIDEEKAVRKWLVAADERLCARCSAMEGQTAPIRGQYPGAVGPPLHPSCRCSEELVYHGEPGLREPRKRTERRPEVRVREKPEEKKRYREDGVPYWLEPPSSIKEYRARAAEWAEKMSKTDPSTDFHFNGKIYRKKMKHLGMAAWDGTMYINRDYDRAFEQWILRNKLYYTQTSAVTNATYLHELLHFSMQGRNRFDYVGASANFEEGINQALTLRLYERFTKDLALDKIQPGILDLGRMPYQELVDGVELFAKYISETTGMSEFDFIRTVHRAGLNFKNRTDTIVDIIKSRRGLKATQSPHGWEDLYYYVMDVMSEIAYQGNVKRRITLLEAFVRRLKAWYE